MKNSLLTIVITVCFFSTAFSQSNYFLHDNLFDNAVQKAQRKDSTLMSDRAFNMYINRAFSQVAAGPSSGGNLSNYASFEPVSGMFSFNGFAAVNAKNNERGRMQYVNFNIKGGIEGNNVAALFTDNKVNSNVSVSLRYHFGLSKRALSYYRSAKYPVDQGKNKIKYQHLYEIEQFRSELKNLNTAIADNVAQIVALKKNREKKEIELDSVRKVVLANTTVENTAKVDTMLAKIEKLIVKLNERESALQALKIKQEQYFPEAITSQMQHIHEALDAMEIKYRDKKILLELDADINRISFGWFSINTDFNKKKYYTYFDDLEFKKQITSHALDAFNIGASYNWFWQNMRTKATVFFDAGVRRIKTNNVAELSPKEVVDTRTVEDDNTKRVVTTKYDAFTSPIVEFNVWRFYLNGYYLFGQKNTSGIHLFPDLGIRSTGKTVTNVGVGYLISFNDAKVDKSILNVEAYVKFTDVGNVLNSGAGFYNRNEIGLSFGIPFNYIIGSSK